jgi:uncharacterized membrane protein YjjP (DUF1212 family)
VSAPAEEPWDTRHDHSLHAFVLGLGRALSLAGAAVSETQERLLRIAAANNAPDARIVVLPTALIISLGRADWATVESIPVLAGTWRLDQISALYELVHQAERGAVEPADGLEALARIRAMRPRHGAAFTVVGYALMTVGLCLILQPTPRDVATAAVLGVLVSFIVLFARQRPTLTLFVPIVSATIVSALTFEAVKRGAADPGLRTLIAPLITFLPGAALTTATVELASGEVVGGASRLVFGAVQMLLLSFGIFAGAEIVGLPSEAAVSDAPANLLGWWAPWLGVLVFGVAASVYFSAPPGALPWLMAVLIAAWTGQVVGDALVGGDVSGFFGALVMTPVALAIARLPGGPPSQVTFLPAFWLLVPGALGLIGVTSIIGDPAAADISDFVKPLGAIVSIALGVLCGVSLFRGLATAPSAVWHGKLGR